MLICSFAADPTTSIIHRSYSTRQPKLTSKFQETSFKSIEEEKANLATSKIKKSSLHFARSKAIVIVASTASKKSVSGKKLFILSNRLSSNWRFAKPSTQVFNDILMNTPKEHSQTLFKSLPDSFNPGSRTLVVKELILARNLQRNFQQNFFFSIYRTNSVNPLFAKDIFK